MHTLWRQIGDAYIMAPDRRCSFIIEEETPVFDHLERDDKSCSRKAASVEDFIELKHFVSSSVEKQRRG